MLLGSRILIVLVYGEILLFLKRKNNKLNLTLKNRFFAAILCHRISDTGPAITFGQSRTCGSGDES